MRLLVAIILPLVACRSAPPSELVQIPARQAALLEAAIEAIEQSDPAWVGPGGCLAVEYILAILRADKAAWSELHRFYTGDQVQ